MIIIKESIRKERKINIWRRKMKKLKTVPFLIEDSNGHSTLNVPEDELKKEVETELVNGKWVTVTHKDGSSELLTKKDIPLSDEITEGHDGVSDDEIEDEDGDDAEDAELMSAFKKDTGKKTTTTKKTTPTPTVKEEWSSKFENVTSATSTAPSKGG
jgi:nucleosome binding factor SPN SPT16 subunit